ncbi:MAG: hypothetical protein K2N94_08685 [Lachnospiraceae bacterium]|nr:hypothetical protein [Lachnospiraceae bacterium]
MERRYKCRCCGYFTLTGENEDDIKWDICPVCFWENDVWEENPDRYSGANHMTLAQGRANFKNYSACESGMVCHVRAPRAEELPENNG